MNAWATRRNAADWSGKDVNEDDEGEYEDGERWR